MEGSDPLTQEFTDAVLLTTERETTSGRLWCREQDGAALKKALTVRGIGLGGLLRQMVRVIRLVDHAGSRGYVGFLYLDLPSLEVRHIRRCIDEAAAKGRLRSVGTVSATGFTFIEPAMAASGVGFSLDFVQMPRLLALLDMLHNMLGYAEVERLVDGLRGPAPASADMIAQTVESSLNAWLSPRLQSLHHMRAANAMREFLVACDRHSEHAINDDVVLEFWRDVGSQDAGADGFRLFASAARHLLSYRSALSIAALERALAGARQIDAPGADLSYPDDLGVDDGQAQVAEAWSSPLRALFTAPAGRIKWLAGTDRDFLAELFDDAAGEKSRTIGALFEDRRPDPGFATTILRAHHFGALQNRWKSGARPATADEPAGYALVSRQYADIVETLGHAGASAALGLLRHGEEAGLSLLVELFPTALPTLAHAFRGEDDDTVVAMRGLDNLAATARVVSAELTSRSSAMGAEVRRAASKVARAGFKESDQSNPETIEALAAGAEALLSLRREVLSLSAKLRAVGTDELFARDREIFHGRFAAMYG